MSRTQARGGGALSTAFSVTLTETTMSDDRKQTDRKPSNSPKDLPAKPVDKKTDDKVKGGVRASKFDV